MENYLKGKRVLFMGDSITALYMESRGWPKYFCEMLEVGHHACVAVPGAHWCDYENTVLDGNPVFNPKDYSGNTMSNQMEKIKLQKAAGNPDFSDFDVIIMAAGTNDDMPESAEICDAQFYRNGAYVPLDEADRKTWGGAIRYVSENLYELYPNAYQFICTPVQADDKIRPLRKILEKGRVLKEIAARLSVRYIDTLYCGIYGRYENFEENGRSLVDGLHPNVNGAKQMAFYNAMAVKNYLG